MHKFSLPMTVKPFVPLRCQFHQRYTRKFFVRAFHFGSFFLVTCTYKSCRNDLRTKNSFVRRMLMKLTAGVNFINVLHTPFSCVSLFNTFLVAFSNMFSFVTFWHQNFVRKMCMYNVDDIDGRVIVTTLYLIKFPFTALQKGLS